jgi:hypothetical protein
MGEQGQSKSSTSPGSDDGKRRSKEPRASAPEDDEVPEDQSDRFTKIIHSGKPQGYANAAGKSKSSPEEHTRAANKVMLARRERASAHPKEIIHSGTQV